MEWLAAQQSAACQGNAPDNAVTLDGFHGVVRAGGVEAALPTKVGAQGNLIQADTPEDQAARQVSRISDLGATHLQLTLRTSPFVRRQLREQRFKRGPIRLVRRVARHLNDYIHRWQNGALSAKRFSEHPFGPIPLVSP
jgi:hypothetical protein